jgi:Flp pilus assembly protein CpaB
VDAVRGPGWRRTVLLRRALAGLLAAAALVLALTPVDADEAPVVVASRDLAAGVALADADLAVARWPAGLVPAGALRSPAELAGRVLAGPVGAGEPLTELRIAGPALTVRTGGADAAAVPVRLADPDVAPLLTTGSRVDVVTLGPSTGEPVVLAADAAVLTVLAATDGAPGSARGRLVLVAMPRDVAARVAAAALSEQVAVTLR